MKNSNVFIERNYFLLHLEKPLLTCNLIQISQMSLLYLKTVILYMLTSSSSVLVVHVLKNIFLPQAISKVYVEPVILVSFLAVSKSLQIKGFAPKVTEGENFINFSNNLKAIKETPDAIRSEKLENPKIPASFKYKEYERKVHTYHSQSPSNGLLKYNGGIHPPRQSVFSSES